MGVISAIDIEPETLKCKNHMFATLHKPLVDNLAGIVLPRMDVNGFLHDGIGTTAQSLSSAILKVM